MEKAADAIEGDRSFRLGRGYGRLAEWLWTGMDRERVRAHFGAVVERISWRRGRVEVQSSAGRFEAPRCTLTSRAGMAGAVSRWLGAIEHLPEISQRLLRVQFENAPAEEVIERFDSKETLFYCDPPYPHDTRGDSKAYGYEMTDEAHRKLAGVLKECRDKVAVSSYHSSLNVEIFKGWRCLEASEKLCHSVKTMRREVLFVNYDPEDITPWLKPRQESFL